MGSQVVTSGVPFILQSGGSVDVRAFGVSQSSGLPIELYIHVFTLSEVVSSPKQTAEANERLTRQKEGRGSYYDTSSPVSGTWRRGEIIYNANPSPGGFVGWVCVETGSPGSWKGFGSISA